MHARCSRCVVSWSSVLMLVSIIIISLMMAFTPLQTGKTTTTVFAQVRSPTENISRPASELGLNVTKIHLDKEPIDVAVNPITNMVYVVDSNGSTSVIDGNTNHIVKSIYGQLKSTSGVPRIAVNPVTNLIYISKYDSNSNTTSVIDVIDGRTNTVVANIDLDRNYTEGIAVNPTTNMIYVIKSAGSSENLEKTIYVIDGKTNHVIKTINFQSSPLFNVSVNPFSNKIYIDSGYIIDGMTNTVVANPNVNASFDGHISVNPTTNMIYVPNYISIDATTINVVDGNTNKITNKIPNIIYLFNDLAVNPTTNMIYVGQAAVNTTTENRLYIVNGKTDEVTNIVKLSSSPDRIAVNSFTNTVYITNVNDNAISIIRENSPRAQFPLSSPQQKYVTWYNSGVNMLNNKSYTDALAAFDNALSINPDQAAAWHNRGTVLDKLGRYQEALDSYNKAINIDPNNARHWNSKGTALYHLGRYQEALDSYNKALSIDPSNTEFQKNRDIAQSKIG